MTNRLRKNWGLYGQAKTFINKAIKYNDQEFKNLDKNNYQLEFGLIKKQKSLFFGAGLNYSNKKYIGYNPLMHNLSSSKIIEKPETQIFTKVGYLLDHKLLNRENYEYAFDDLNILKGFKINPTKINRKKLNKKKILQ